MRTVLFSILLESIKRLELRVWTNVALKDACAHVQESIDVQGAEDRFTARALIAFVFQFLTTATATKPCEIVALKAKIIYPFNHFFNTVSHFIHSKLDDIDELLVVNVQKLSINDLLVVSLLGNSFSRKFI